jgi:hypothetical protein
LKLNLNKCEIAKTSIGFLGQVVSRDGTQLDQHKIKAIIEFPIPIIVTNVRVFLGLTKYYQNYVKGYSHIVTTLLELTKKRT